MYRACTQGTSTVCVYHCSHCHCGVKTQKGSVFLNHMKKSCKIFELYTHNCLFSASIFCQPHHELLMPPFILEGLGHSNSAGSLGTQNKNGCIYSPQSQHDKTSFPSHPYCADYVLGQRENTDHSPVCKHPPSLLSNSPLIQTPLTSHICSSSSSSRR